MSSTPSTARKTQVNCSRFFHEWKGHPVELLEIFDSSARAARPDKPVIYLAGDSSLDNKAWVPSSGPAGEELPVEVPDIYTQLLDRPKPKPDVAFWLNHVLGDKATAINTAVEESMLRERDDDLLPHDKFIRDHIRPQDILIVSVGANDVALKPNGATMRNMLQLAWLTPRCSLENGTAWALGYFRNMFGAQTQHYIYRIIAKQKPRAVIICTIYYPLEAGAGQQSWADVQLKALGYNRSPGQLQAAIRAIYKGATKTMELEGTTVVPSPLFEVLDGKTKEDYVARVEPSAEGGRKMAAHFETLLEPFLE